MTNTHLAKARARRVATDSQGDPGARVRGERGVKPPTGWMIRQAIPGCATCTEVGRKGCCAPLRCYCGHESCHAFASWTPLQPLNVTHIGKSTPARNLWDNREDSTWIDKL